MGVYCAFGKIHSKQFQYTKMKWDNFKYIRNEKTNLYLTYDTINIDFIHYTIKYILCGYLDRKTGGHNGMWHQNNSIS